MLIEEYFQDIEQAIAQSYVIIDAQLVTDKRSLYIGFLEGTLTFCKFQLKSVPLFQLKSVPLLVSIIGATLARLFSYELSFFRSLAVTSSLLIAFSSCS